MKTAGTLKELLIKSSPSQNLKNCCLKIGQGALECLTDFILNKPYSRIFLISDQVVAQHWAAQVQKLLPENSELFTVASGELHKTLESATQLWTALQEKRADRKALIINLGGGAVSDVGGFVASTYLRGVSFLNIPTTLLAQVDASVGGKVGVNFGHLKNVLGAFSQSEAVLIDPIFLKTLPGRELHAGLAEMLKHGAMFNAEHFDTVMQLGADPLKSPLLAQEIARSVELKAEIVMRDEREQNERRLLNFGHTFGHAFESISLESDHPLLHGEAVGLGMIYEALLAEQLGVASKGVAHSIEQALIRCKLPVQLPAYIAKSGSEIVQRIYSDKKVQAEKLVFALPREIGMGVVVEDVPVNMVEQAFEAAAAKFYKQERT